MLSVPKTGPTETHGAGEAPRVPLVHVSPEKLVCLINKLPSELLSHVFDMAMWDCVDRSTIEMFLWIDLVRYLSAKRAGQEDPRDSNVERISEDEEDSRVEDEDVDEDEDEDVDDEDEDEDEDDWTDEDEEDWTDEDEDDWTDEDECDWPAPTQSSDYSSPRYPIHTVVPRVRHHWRNVAFSTPSLWTTVVVSPEAGLTYEREAKILERSKNLPIDIIIDFEHNRGRDWAGEPSVTELQHFFALFSPHIHRWRTMKVTASEYIQMYLFLCSVSNSPVSSAPQLRKLELNLSTPMYKLLHSTMPFFGDSAPLLTELVLRGVSVSWNRPWIASASNLTVLRLVYVRPSWAEFATILRGAPALQTLEVRMSGPYEDPSGWIIESTHTDLNTPIELAQLTEFRFASDSRPRAVTLFQNLRLPGIKNLSLNCEIGDHTDLVLELAGSAISSSAPSGEQSGSLLSRLHTLVLSALICTMDCVPTVYGELQNLTSLRLAMPCLPRQFFHILGTRCTLAGRSKVWLPRLETLHVAGISGSALRDMLQKRSDAGACLGSLTVFLEASSKVDKADAKWLRTNLKEFDIFIGGF